MTAVIERTTDPRIRLGFDGLVRSEWIKVRTLRSTWWSAAVTVVLMAGLAGLAAWGITSAGIPSDTSDGLLAVTLGHAFAQLALAVFAVLVITGEYATGMIRSTLAAAPRRMPVYLSKALIVVLVTAAIAVIGTALAIAVAQPILASAGSGLDFTSAEQLQGIAGQVIYLVLVAAFAFGIGALVKNSAAGIVIVVGVLFALPIVVQIVAALTRIEWLADVYQYLPSVAGQQMMMIGQQGDNVLTPAAGFAVLAAYAVVALVAGGFAMAKRDD